jgi:hypothetical protein
MWILGIELSLAFAKKCRFIFMNFMKMADRQGGNGVWAFSGGEFLLYRSEVNGQIVRRPGAG